MYGLFYICICFYVVVDIIMRSPPVSPSQEPALNLQGSSRITGGFLCGQAQGNIFNNVDAEDLMPTYGLEPRMGRVQVYTAHADPTLVKPDMELNYKVTPKLMAVLGALGHRYSPVQSIGFQFLLCIYLIILFF